MHYAQWSNFAPGMGESQPMLHEIAPDPTNLETFPVLLIFNRQLFCFVIPVDYIFKTS